MKRTWNAFVHYLFIPLSIIATFLLVFSNTKGEAEVVKSQPRQPVVSRESLRIITPAVIKSKNLTLDWGLQEFIANSVKHSRSGLITVAVLNPRNGEILALYGKDASGENCSLALDAYLAASLFKVVTAAAAIDYAGMSTDSTCTYTGNAHTLFKSQIDIKKNRLANEVTFAKAFASSNNVIFGKIGAFQLGETPLLLTAMRLGFWKSPIVDSQCTPSTVFIPENEFNLAELASGYNRYTRVSPVHAAQMVSAVLNNGQMIRPKLLRSSDSAVEQVISKDTAEALRAMMCQTVKSGTVARAFYNSRNDRILKGLTIGAKSGTINGVEPDGRRTWFMGFAEDASTGESIAIGCLVIRDAKTRANAFNLARGVIREHFSKPAMVAASNT